MILRLGAFLAQHAVPAVLAAGFYLLQRAGVVRWIPVAPAIEREWGEYALLISMVTAVVASVWYADKREYQLVDFLVTVGVSVTTAIPAMMAPFAVQLGFTPDGFSVLSRATYVAFWIANGFLAGGAWAFLIERFRAAGPEG